MSHDPTDGPFAPRGENTDEYRPATIRPEKPQLPKRFYREVAAPLVDGVHPLLLDGRPARTPGRNPLVAPDSVIAEALVGEWQAQADEINPATMPMTRLINSIIDGVSQTRDAVVEETVRFAGSDLLCYRAAHPDRLVRRQEELWDPLLDWARERLGARFILAEGVMFVEQPPASIEAVRKAVEAQTSPHAIGALHVLTSLAGSILIALALAYRHIDAEAAWRAAHVDEDVQAEIWGADAEAQARRAARFTEFAAAAALVRQQWQA